MENITSELLREITNNLMLELEEEEYKLLAEEFCIVLEQMKLVQTIDVEGYEPMHYPFLNSQHLLREDDNVMINEQSLVLQNAWEVKDDYIVINRVVE